MDGLDGTVARISGRQSDLGAYLDIVLDFFRLHGHFPSGWSCASPASKAW
ncbi:MAG: CDP-alcohol phosphatidyltransferase family protein [Chloroflexi bacterium]|nr:CDP-alcohol phosphatidyltransferase family protein [Chloroflexota bacterium]